ncbi:hypothetical protein FA15DRAFT_324210 [Coprinopsis marcescibilis]|uniref:Secreted protein n=1 Tax=Coprinopsis marcescibilis TaxID=230819 RepID=A0A5C3L097_COPMA|nr:hypothetical protein FA15DRAFT_324210 [Coprinopsis marcescibilis]
MCFYFRCTTLYFPLLLSRCSLRTCIFCSLRSLRSESDARSSLIRLGAGIGTARKLELFGRSRSSQHRGTVHCSILHESSPLVPLFCISSLPFATVSSCTLPLPHVYHGSFDSLPEFLPQSLNFVQSVLAVHYLYFSRCVV